MRTPETLELPFGEPRRVLSVSGLNREARLLIENGLGMIWVEGEISNLSRPSSGHLYFALKDASAQIRCAMFRQQNRMLDFEPANGRQVLVRARVTLYEARGEFQLVVESMEEAGEGLLRRKFEQLKRKLAAEGLFDALRKRARPAMPARIGIVTSPTGAALRDVLIALRRRFPATAVLIYPTAVQGAAAAEEIRRTLELADRRAECDLLILTRGGGSLEDLWSFNEEVVARAIASVQIPVIVGVGHETDFTIADFVADLRAPTPSQAAELAVPNQAEWLHRFTRIERQLTQAARSRLAVDGRRADALDHRLQRCHPRVQVREGVQRLDELEGRLVRALERRLGREQTRLARLAAAVSAANPKHAVTAAGERLRWAVHKLERSMSLLIEARRRRLDLDERALASLSPTATLQRGYAIVARRDDRHIVTDETAAPPGTPLTIRLANGRIDATVDDETHTSPI